MKAFRRGISSPNPAQARSATFLAQALVASGVCNQYQKLFSKLYGLSLRLLMADGETRCDECIPNGFCRLATQYPILAAGCRKADHILQRSVAPALVSQRMKCHAGLTEVGIPIVVDDTHVATLLAGRVMDHVAKESDFVRIAKRLQGGISDSSLKKLRKAYLETRTVTPKQLSHLIQLLELAAEHMAQRADMMSMYSSDEEAPLVRKVKELVFADLANISRASQVAERVHCSTDHLTRLFKTHMGSSLTGFLGCARIEKAKQLLSKQPMKIVDVAFAVGFGSVSQFNRMFIKYTGVAPQEWRAQSRKKALIR